MLVYGDWVRRADPREVLDGLARRIAALAALPAGIARHAVLAGLLIEAGELAQGIADAEAAERELDEDSPAQETAMALLLGCAGALRASWTGGFAAGALPTLPRFPALPARIEARLAEGFAFYALYPETYALAAAASGLPPTTRVVGLRSIGAPLAAMVAAALGAAPPATLRPRGHPFRREVALGPGLAARLAPAAQRSPVHASGPPGSPAICPGTPVAVVDEGPGLSGSSFGAVADWLEERGQPPGRIAFFPSHGGAPGPQASPRHRARWDGAARHWCGFEDAILPRLPAWVAELTGPAEGPPEDIAGGAWRARLLPESAWPPVNAMLERRKYLLPAGGRTWLLKFAGLGAEGERKAARAAALAEAGLAPPVAGWRHGFSVQPWLAEARPLEPGALPRERLAAPVAQYLEFRARAFPAEAGRGASPADLHAMARHNAAEALGEDAAGWFSRWTPGDLARLDRLARPVETDNRMQAWEWLRLPDGRLLKADAVDHHAAHDLVGCQDIAWDVAGAVVELGLDPLPMAEPALLALLLPCYCAFQLGAWSMAADSAPDAAEAGRCRAAARRYAQRLQEEMAR
ncbi:hypothetical protein [Roseicella aquatilis]|uniref:Uncharacterized protein n=1 Tax=Roseicella aquatilis TaxID=2527868 RepID=A0A4V6P5Z7_9PROT|nr:hypothetical protein [Roseicella aquatilis]TCZ59887.1 hypothetical protein EXY23_14925 [Roseicella aquatilis]